MKKEDYELLKKLTDSELFDFITEKESSLRKWIAMHLLELRSNKVLTSAERASAIAAWLAAVIAGVSAVVAILAYFRGIPS